MYLKFEGKKSVENYSRALHVVHAVSIISIFHRFNCVYCTLLNFVGSQLVF